MFYSPWVKVCLQEKTLLENVIKKQTIHHSLLLQNTIQNL